MKVAGRDRRQSWQVIRAVSSLTGLALQAAQHKVGKLVYVGSGINRNGVPLTWCKEPPKKIALHSETVGGNCVHPVAQLLGVQNEEFNVP